MVEKAKGMCYSQAKHAEFGDRGKYIQFSSDSRILPSINEDAVNKDLSLAGYNLLVTSETKMKDQDIYFMFLLLSFFNYHNSKSV